jgi:hypothetical protein
MSTENATLVATERRGRMRTLLVVWFGQTISVIGTGLTTFALGVWVYQKTGSVTQFALISVLSYAPLIVLSPVAGVYVDRWDRRRTMLIADLTSGAIVFSLFALLAAGHLEIWQIYLATAGASTVGAFHFPAYAAATTLMVAKERFGHVGGLVEFSSAASVTLPPVVAGALIFSIGLRGVLVVDCATFLFSASCLAMVRIPRPERQPHGSLLTDIKAGLRYLGAHAGLRRLLAQFSAMNLLNCFLLVLIIPLVLSTTTERRLGLTVTLGTLGFVVGGVTMSLWGGPRRRARGIVLCSMAQGIGMIIAGLRQSPVLVAIGLFCFYFWVPIMNGSSQAIWQSRVPPGLQGRVFAIRRTLAQATAPISYALAGPLADHVFVPPLRPGGALAGNVGRLVGTGPGRGVGLMVVILGVLCIAVNVVSLRSRPLMNVEQEPSG